MFKYERRRKENGPGRAPEYQDFKSGGMVSKIFHTKISSRFFPGKRSQVTGLRTSYPYDTAKLFHILPVKINFDMETNGYIRNSAEEKNNVQELKKRQKKHTSDINHRERVT